MRPSGVTCQTVPVFVSTAASRRDRPGECAGHASVNEFGGSWGRRRVSSPGQRGGCHRRQRTVRTVNNSAYGVQTGLRGSGRRPLTGSQGFSRKRGGGVRLLMRRLPPGQVPRSPLQSSCRLASRTHGSIPPKTPPKANSLGVNRWPFDGQGCSGTRKHAQFRSV